MRPSNKKAVIVLSFITLGLSVTAFTLLFAHHGTRSYARFTDVKKPLSLSSASPVKSVPCMIAKEAEYRLKLQEKGTEFQSGAYLLESVEAYTELTDGLNQTIQDLPSDFFSHSKLLAIEREGTFIKEGITARPKLKNGTFSVIFLIEDDQVLSDETEEKGVFTYDFFTFDKDAVINSVAITDRLF